MDIPVSPQEGPNAPTTAAGRFLAHHRVRYFHCGQNKHQAFPNGVRPADQFAFIQLNPADWLNFLVVDVDREDALMCLMHPAVPPPTWIIENEENGHAQAGWAIESVYRGEGARPHPILYAEAVQQALDRLVGGDPHFARHLVRNPAAEQPAGRVWWGRRQRPWSLGDLKAHMCEFVDPFHDETHEGPDPGAWNPGPAQPFPTGAPLPPAGESGIGGRNNTLFYATRRWLWDRWRTRRQVPTHAAAIEHAQALNAQLPHPLPDGELQCLARSAVRQVNKGNDRPTRTTAAGASREHLARLGRRGGQARTEAKVAAAQGNVAAARQARTTQVEQLRATAGQMHAAGATYQAISAAVGRAERTIRNWLKTTPIDPTPRTVPDRAKQQATGIGPAAQRLDPTSQPSTTVVPTSPSTPLERPVIRSKPRAKAAAQKVFRRRPASPPRPVLEPDPMLAPVIHLNDTALELLATRGWTHQAGLHESTRSNYGDAWWWMPSHLPFDLLGEAEPVATEIAATPTGFSVHLASPDGRRSHDRTGHYATLGELTAALDDLEAWRVPTTEYVLPAVRVFAGPTPRHICALHHAGHLSAQETIVDLIHFPYQDLPGPATPAVAPTPESFPVLRHHRTRAGHPMTPTSGNLQQLHDAFFRGLIPDDVYDAVLHALNLSSS